MICLCFYLILVVLPYSNGQNVSYKAAVVEFATSTATNIQERFTNSLKEYIKLIQEASIELVDILVFPEGGLTGLQLTHKQIAEISIFIPNIENISFCLHPKKNRFNKFLTKLSCAAKNNKIYVVVNVIEEDDENENIIYYSTNLVFNREGVVIAKYRKINLSKSEENLSQGNSLTTFTTDFGVSFGMFITNDIMFQTPSSSILEDTSITDIIYSTAWYSTTTFFTANTLQHGYSKTNGVNLLAAGLNNPSKQNGGSGIYLHNGVISKQYISDTSSSKMLTSNIPIIKSRHKLLNTCQNSSIVPFSESTNSPNILPLDTLHYKAKSLNLEKGKVSETICGTGHDFCCTFNILFNSTSISDYVYQIVVFKDTTALPIDGCGLVACLNDDIESCGKTSKVPIKRLQFSSISIKTISLIKDGDRPVMLLPDLKAGNNYKYCKHEMGRKVRITLSTTEEESHFLVFGIFILNYNLDNCETNNLITWYLLGTCTLIVLTVLYKRSNVIRNLRQ